MNGGVGFFTLLQILFIIGLKLGGVITWSWFWVLFPLFVAPVLIFLLVFTILMAKK